MRADFEDGPAVIWKGQVALCCIASHGSPKTGIPWEHVSVHVEDHRFNKRGVQRIPTWEEMQAVKERFWNDDEVVMQLHPAKKDWINCHPHVLHLWKPTAATIPLPPKIAV